MALIRVMIWLVHLDGVACYCQMNAIEGAAIEHQSSLGRLRLREVDLRNMRALVKINLLYPASDRRVSPQPGIWGSAAYFPQKLKRHVVKSQYP